MNNMKTIKRFLALLLFFVAAMNVQTLSAQTNGDVNNDGTVNEADITAIIEIMKEANGVGPKKYYWYVGTEKLTSDSEVESKGIQISSSSQITNPLTWTSSDYVYFIYPTEFGTAKIVDEGGDDAGGKAIESLSGVSFTKYKGWRFNKENQGIKYSITFVK